MRRVRLLLFGVGLAGLTVASSHSVGFATQPAQAENVSLPPDVVRLRAWVDTVRLYEAGKADSELVALAKWPMADLTATLTTLSQLRDALARAYPRKGGLDHRHVVKAKGGEVAFPAAVVQEMLGQSDAEARQGDANRLLRRGAVMHTDIGILVSAQVIAVPDAKGEPSSIRVVDGRRIGTDHAKRHWQMAAALLDAVTPEPARDETVHSWYLAMAVYWRAQYNLGAGDELLRRGRELFPRDPDIQFHSGCVQEALAAPRVHSAVVAMTPPVSITSNLRVAPIPLTATGARLQLHWEAAARYFREAVRLRPDWPEARLRLGRVLGLLGRHRDAATELRRALAGTDHPTLTYYASLFLGDEEQALGRRDAARTCYERASGLRPRAQAPHLALSLLARSAGDRAGALAQVRVLFDQPPDEARRYDPVWDYFGPRSITPHTLLARLRLSVGIGGGQ